ncbi:MAG TPA: hypothetical protein VFI64_00125, partial [Nitrososphaeraceae archaeon]|nr:hypothetical protein [Nitrososphaeraceae archaeon]
MISITATTKAAIGIKLLPEAVFVITNHSVVIQQTGVIAMEINLELADNMNISMSRTFKFQWGYYNNSNKFIDKWLEENPIQLRQVRQISKSLKQIFFTQSYPIQRTIDRANALSFSNIHLHEIRGEYTV